MHFHGHQHGQGDGHSHHGHSQEIGKEGNKKGLSIALFITTGIMLLEFVGGLVSNSLALLSDSGHMLSDAGSLALSLIAIWFASKPPSSRKTFGYYRVEILAALLNGATLVLISGFILWEAYERILEPPMVASITMIGIASVGLIANLGSAWALMRSGDVKGNLNVRSAYLHILGDSLGSVGAIGAGIVMLAFGWYIADPIISGVVAILILISAWRVVRDSINVLMEGTPPTVDFKEVAETLKQIEGVIGVHDLHIWTITSGLDSLSCHLIMEKGGDSQRILQQAVNQIAEKFNIEHTTIQVETDTLEHPDTRI
jgi:cobalt-zinc-cadmium efflux system protein